ncbi:MAG TPA: tetratricopeptide repeat protein, partial [Candidatus Saccharimonadales bacterium]|nr:tetratricopeptide repeat protein [Candidatus Saccharimonadales bacterium]
MKVWTVAGAKQLLKLEGHTDRVLHIAFSTDGRRIASASSDKTVRVWEPATAKEIVALKDHKAPVAFVVFSPQDRRRLASVGEDGTLKVWDVYTDKDALISGIATVKELGPYLEIPAGPDLAASTVGLMGSPFGQGAVLTVSAISMGRTKALGGIGHVAFHPDGVRLALAGDDKTVKIWDINRRIKLHELQGHTRRVYRVAFSKDGKFLASAGDDKTVIVWDANAGKKIRDLEGHTGKVYQIVFSPDGERLASVSDDNTVRVWDLSTDKKPLILEEHDGRINQVAFSPDGQRLATAGDDKTAKVWDAVSGKRLLNLQGHTARVTQAVFNPDPNGNPRGRRVVTSSDDKTVKIWDAATGQELLTLQDQTVTLGVNHVLFSPDGQRLASAGNDKAVMVWESALDTETMARRERVWQAAQAKSLVAAGQWAAAEFHLSQLIKDNPEAAWYQRRADVYAEQEQWERALQDFAAVRKIEPANFSSYYYQGMVFLAKGDLANFRDVCAAAFEKFKDKASPAEADYLVWLAVAAPSGARDFKALPLIVASTVGLMGSPMGPEPFLPALVLVSGGTDFKGLVELEKDKALTTDPESVDFLESLGSAHYRAGDFAAAARRLEEAVKKQGKGGTVWMQLLLAMAHHQLKHPDETRNWLHKAAAQMVAQEVVHWETRVRWDYLLREAETLMGTPVFLVRVQSQLTAADPKYTVRNSSYRKVYEVSLAAGKTYRIEMLRNKDATMESYLRLEDSNGNRLADNDGMSKAAHINFNCPRDDKYKIIATTYMGGTGKFTLTVLE